MKKLFDRLLVLSYILAGFVVLQDFGGVAFIWEKLNLAEPYIPEDENFSLFHPDYLIFAQDLELEKSSAAQKFKAISSYHQSISTKRCYHLLKKTFLKLPSVVIDTIYADGFQMMLLGEDIRGLVALETGWKPHNYYKGITFFNDYHQIWSTSSGGTLTLLLTILMNCFN